MVEDTKRTKTILCILGIIPVVWVALLIAPNIDGGLVSIINGLADISDNFYKVEICENSLKTVLFFLLVYGLSLAMYFTTRKNYRKREEYGSAKWGSARLVNKKYSDKDKFKNKLLTQNVAIGLDGRKHRRNLNTLVCGGSGAGKTRFYCKPNLMQCNTSLSFLIYTKGL